MTKLLLHITLIGSLFQLPNLFGQPPINERYVIDDETYSVFSTVFSNDSCYYVSGLQGSIPSFTNASSALAKYRFDGTIENLGVIHNDTLGIAFMNMSHMIKTIDGNFTHIAIAQKSGIPSSFIFVKMNPNGDTLLTNYYSEFYSSDGLIGKNPGKLIQKSDGTFYGFVSVQREDDLRGATVFYKLNENGVLLDYNIYYGLDPIYYRILNPHGLVKYNDDEFIILASLQKPSVPTEEQRFHTKLIKVNSEGEILEEHTYWDDPLSFDCKGLTKTPDGGLLYCGRIGQYFPDFGGYNDYKLRIVKLNSDFEEEWEIELGEYTILSYLGFNQIKPINDSEYVAVGFHTTSEDYQTGILVKFNLSGEKIWERRYRKIPHYGSEIAQHRLYDVDITPDNGFVMVGDAINHYETEDLPGQKAWLIKVDSFGCLVPGCHELDLGISENITNYESVPVYPNPATNSLFYYHHQDNFEPVQVTIFSANGQTVQTWQINTNDITCEVDVSDFQVGMYILKVTDKKGVVLETQQFVKE
ncbi:T9SS type A sorting domain-containing protein [Crocinitomix algicola]|uniref:T9SS type A sorting domain-containing protein n=1 Tax=Crocinitomix algicola TaxID=1740263 RepID=UPI0008357F2A|nr:T9SS type A sorting domain-containing protein [Crocinitomix algicola]